MSHRLIREEAQHQYVHAITVTILASSSAEAIPYEPIAVDIILSG